MYNHLEDGWNEHERPTVTSQHKHWWNDKDWSRKLRYLKNGVVAYESN